MRTPVTVGVWVYVCVCVCVYVCAHARHGVCGGAYRAHSGGGENKINDCARDVFARPMLEIRRLASLCHGGLPIFYIGSHSIANCFHVDSCGGPVRGPKRRLLRHLHGHKVSAK